MRFSVARVEKYRVRRRRHRTFEITARLQHVAQIQVRARIVRIDINRFPDPRQCQRQIAVILGGICGLDQCLRLLPDSRVRCIRSRVVRCGWLLSG